ncbi:MAG: ABC transporter permease [Actinomycetaceae bacterium]|nr:ABC transporter permease [Actinomycetaceae bacterium]
MNPWTAYSAIIEAWEEIRINRARVILSLIGVAAAVWAMSTVIALGSLVSASSQAASAQMQGVPGTIEVFVSPSDDGGDAQADPAYSVEEPTEQATSAPSVEVDAEGRPIDDFSRASLAVVTQTKANLWTRSMTKTMIPQAPGLPTCDNSDSDENFDPTDVCQANATMRGVDAGYFDIYPHSLIAGRLLTRGDAQLAMNPTVITRALWEALGTPDLAGFPKFSMQEHPRTAFTIVGVVADNPFSRDMDAWTSYEAMAAALPSASSDPEVTRYFTVTAPLEKAQEASDAVVASLKARLGPKWQAESYYDDASQQADASMMRKWTLAIAAAGGIVILIGALGLLTVSIVTIKQRVREIGIRRAMGASGKRIFFSVFLESVVATTVAGFLGIVASVATVRSGLLDRLMMTSTELPYPMTAALIGLSIAAAVGALCGIIPATIAVRIKPIDAIRY